MVPRAAGLHAGDNETVERGEAFAVRLRFLAFCGDGAFFEGIELDGGIDGSST